MSYEIIEKGPLAAAGERRSSLHCAPDAELAERWWRGDDAALQDLVRSRAQSIYRVLYRMFGAAEAAAVGGREVCMSLARRRHRLRPRAATFSTVAYSAIAQVAQRRRFRPVLRASSSLSSAEAHPHGVFDASALQAALLALPPALRLSLLLYDVEKLSYPEMMAALGWPPGAVAIRVCRAREAVQRALEHSVGERRRRARHADVQSRFGAYLEGELTLDRRALIDAHLDRCETCREELRALRKLVEDLRSLTEPVLPDGVLEGWLAALDAQKARRRFWSRFF